MYVLVKAIFDKKEQQDVLLPCTLAEASDIVYLENVVAEESGNIKDESIIPDWQAERVLDPLHSGSSPLSRLKNMYGIKTYETL